LINKVQYKKTEYKNKIVKAEEINQDTIKQIDEDRENFVKIITHYQKILEKLKND
jgi:Fe-S cluster assembly ATPase SufC